MKRENDGRQAWAGRPSCFTMKRVLLNRADAPDTSPRRRASRGRLRQGEEGEEKSAGAGLKRAIAAPAEKTTRPALSRTSRGATIGMMTAMNAAGKGLEGRL